MRRRAQWTVHNALIARLSLVGCTWRVGCHRCWLTCTYGLRRHQEPARHEQAVGRHGRDARPGNNGCRGVGPRDRRRDRRWRDGADVAGECGAHRRDGCQHVRRQRVARERADDQRLPGGRLEVDDLQESCTQGVAARRVTSSHPRTTPRRGAPYASSHPSRMARSDALTGIRGSKRAEVLQRGVLRRCATHKRRGGDGDSVPHVSGPPKRVHDLKAIPQGGASNKVSIS